MHCLIIESHGFYSYSSNSFLNFHLLCSGKCFLLLFLSSIVLSFSVTYHCLQIEMFCWCKLHWKTSECLSIKHEEYDKKNNKMYLRCDFG